ncbi:MAG: hypothetical protein WC806_05560 [Candidatus Gracilibacteria bacterium]|jgi:1-deoxy-D-xylulose 5-phosphate reductoisomerase
MKKIIILGSTGNLGQKALNILKKYKKEFKIIGLSAYQNEGLLKKQAKEFKVNNDSVILVKKDGEKKLINLVKTKEADVIINFLSGISGILPTMLALKNKKIVILANKEAIVAKGYEMKKYLHQIIPVDSEHNAIFEILKTHPKGKIKNIYLPCSGGPLYEKTKKELSTVSLKQVLSHPKWKMGKKISVESATLINKGFEIIEAHYLFNIPLKNIKVFLHKEAQIHGIVEFVDGKILAYISEPNMAIHIENAIRHVALNLLAVRSRRQRTVSGSTLGSVVLNLPACREAWFQNLRCKKNPHVKIYKKELSSLPKINNKNLKGIEIVLSVFKKDKKNMEKFLKKEEKIIQDFLDDKTTFAIIRNLLAYRIR